MTRSRPNAPQYPTPARRRSSECRHGAHELRTHYDETLKDEAHSSPGVRLAHRVCGIGRVAAGWRRALLEAEKLRAIGRVSSRLLGTFLSDTWSYYFDAVVVIRQEVAPTFDPW